MIVSLSESCPLLRETNQIHLARLLGTVAAQQNLIASPTPQRLGQLVSPAVWAIYREHIMQSYKGIVNSSQHWAKHSDCGSCIPERVSRFYALPTLVIVENLTTDGSWLLLVISSLRPRLRRNVTGVTAHVQLEQAGGVGEIPKIVRRKAADYLFVKPAGDVSLKIVVVADSDSRMPGAISADAREVIAAAAETGTAVHITRKRSIENYVPNEALRVYSNSRRDRSAAAAFITSLLPPARDHYPMKDGVSQQELDASVGMYPAGTPCGLGMGDFIADFFDHFAHSLTARDLRNRDGEGELERLLDTVEGNL